MKPYELIAELVRLEGGSLPTAKKMGKPSFQSQLHKYAAGLVLNPTRPTAERIANFFKIPVDALYDQALATSLAVERGLIKPGESHEKGINMKDSSHKRIHRGIAHDLSHVGPIVFPTILSWEELMQRDLPAEFSLVVRDDAMSDDYEVGDIVFFKTATKPAPGKKVLVVDQGGNAYIRKYRVRAGTHWEAVALNDSYATLDSVKDGLRVLAVAHGSYRD